MFDFDLLHFYDHSRRDYRLDQRFADPQGSIATCLYNMYSRDINRFDIFFCLKELNDTLLPAQFELICLANKDRPDVQLWLAHPYNRIVMSSVVTNYVSILTKTRLIYHMTELKHKGYTF